LKKSIRARVEIVTEYSSTTHSASICQLQITHTISETAMTVMWISQLQITQQTMSGIMYPAATTVTVLVQGEVVVAMMMVAVTKKATTARMTATTTMVMAIMAMVTKTAMKMMAKMVTSIYLLPLEEGSPLGEHTKNMGVVLSVVTLTWVDTLLYHLRMLQVLHASPNGTVFDNFVTCGYVILYQFFLILTLFHSFI
jgi:hypothetical protein